METQDIRNAFYDTLDYLRSSDMQGVLIRTRKNTLLYPGNFCTWHHKPLCNGVVEVIDRTLLETCVKYGAGAKTAVLTTGDPENPGESARKGIENSESEMFATINELKTLLINFAVCALVALTVITLVIISKMTKPLKAVEGSIVALQELDITERRDIQKYAKKKDLTHMK